MTAEEFRAAIDEIGLSQVQAARMLNANERTARRWASGEIDIPTPVAIVLRLMLRYRISPRTVRRLWDPDSGAN
jgi:DNA-binding transcriptional regulator YiaG